MDSLLDRVRAVGARLDPLPGVGSTDASGRRVGARLRTEFTARSDAAGGRRSADDLGVGRSAREAPRI